LQKKEANFDWIESIQLGLIEERGSAPLRLAVVVQGVLQGVTVFRKKGIAYSSPRLATLSIV
jgi:hypothetical protein